MVTGDRGRRRAASGVRPFLEVERFGARKHGIVPQCHDDQHHRTSY
jgi:hypothetical protein